MGVECARAKRGSGDAVPSTRIWRQSIVRQLMSLPRYSRLRGDRLSDARFEQQTCRKKGGTWSPVVERYQPRCVAATFSARKTSPSRSTSVQFSAGSAGNRFTCANKASDARTMITNLSQKRQKSQFAATCFTSLQSGSEFSTARIRIL